VGGYQLSGVAGQFDSSLGYLSPAAYESDTVISLLPALKVA
jgi:hypothetical protein